MARLARVVGPDIPHHICQRGNRRQRVFFCDDDRRIYLELLGHYTRQHGVAIWAYCLMDNHVHLVAVPSHADNLARAIGETHRRYTRHVHFREGWRGYLWQGRFASHPMDERYLYAAVRYVERNPVRAGLVAHAEDYPWSSAPSHVSHTKDPLLSGEEVQLLNVKDWKTYLRDFEDEKELKQIRVSTRTGRPAGNNEFLDQLEKITGRLLQKKKPGPKRD